MGDRYELEKYSWKLFQVKYQDPCFLERILSARSTKTAMIRLWSKTNNEGNWIPEVGKNALNTDKKEICIKSYVLNLMYLEMRFFPSRVTWIFVRRDDVCLEENVSKTL